MSVAFSPPAEPRLEVIQGLVFWGGHGRKKKARLDARNLTRAPGRECGPQLAGGGRLRGGKTPRGGACIIEPMALTQGGPGAGLPAGARRREAAGQLRVGPDQRDGAGGERGAAVAADGAGVEREGPQPAGRRHVQRPGRRLGPAPRRCPHRRLPHRAQPPARCCPPPPAPRLRTPSLLPGPRPAPLWPAMAGRLRPSAHGTVPAHPARSRSAGPRRVGDSLDVHMSCKAGRPTACSGRREAPVPVRPALCLPRRADGLTAGPGCLGVWCCVQLRPAPCALCPDARRGGAGTRCTTSCGFRARRAARR